ncbi:MAG: hypothetical protein ABDH61_03060 [Acidilobaceae archaeon]
MLFKHIDKSGRLVERSKQQLEGLLSFPRLEMWQRLGKAAFLNASRGDGRGAGQAAGDLSRKKGKKEALVPLREEELMRDICKSKEAELEEMISLKKALQAPSTSTRWPTQAGRVAISRSWREFSRSKSIPLEENSGEAATGQGEGARQL